MKRVAALILVLTLLVVTGTIVSADGHTRRNEPRPERTEQVLISIRVASVFTDVTKINFQNSTTVS